MKFSAIISCSLIAFAASGQSDFDVNKLSADGKSILAKIETDDYVPSDSMGFWFPVPKDYPLTVLRKKLGVAELMELVKHHNPIVRCYAFKALTMVSEP